MIRKKLMIFLLITIIMHSLTMNVISHSGGTDSNGGHKDNQNKSGLGSYHYHHGNGPHLHTGGSCPYAKKETNNKSSKITNTLNEEEDDKTKEDKNDGWKVVLYIGIGVAIGNQFTKRVKK